METSTLNVLSRAMKAYSHRMQALSNNIANLDTPGYKRLSVSFEEELQEARQFASGSNDEIDVEPRTTVDDSPPLLEDELMELADTQMRTQLATKALQKHFSLMRMGIIGRAG